MFSRQIACAHAVAATDSRTDRLEVMDARHRPIGAVSVIANRTRQPLCLPFADGRWGSGRHPEFKFEVQYFAFLSDLLRLCIAFLRRLVAEPLAWS